jgi:hypothetical protein
MLGGMSFRADLYGPGDHFDRTERYDADSRPEAVETARQLVVALGLHGATVWESDDLGRIEYVDTVGAER